MLCMYINIYEYIHIYSYVDTHLYAQRLQNGFKELKSQGMESSWGLKDLSIDILMSQTETGELRQLQARPLQGHRLRSLQIKILSPFH